MEASPSRPLRKSKKQCAFDSSLSDRVSRIPVKPIQLGRRSRNRGVALSLKDVRTIAQGLRKSPRYSSNLVDNQEVDDPVDTDSVTDILPKPVNAKTKSKTKLPEKQEMLVQFFHRMLCSIRLLARKGMRSTFTNINSVIETLTDRRFSYRHLAQLKYILPEAIKIEKILIRDEKTSCMKPELQVTLKFDAFKIDVNRNDGHGYEILNKMFRARLLNFMKTHVEGEEIPSEVLPEPFNESTINDLPKFVQIQQKTFTSSFDQTKGSVVSVRNKMLESQMTTNTSLETPLSRPSHISQSFQKRFSRRIMPEYEFAELIPSTSSMISKAHVESPDKCSSNPSESKRYDASCSSHFKPPPSSIVESHEKETTPKKSEALLKELDGIEGTPLKMILSPSRPMPFNAEVQTPKRCRPDDDSTPSNKSARRSTHIRSLKFHTPTKDSTLRAEHIEDGVSAADAAILKILPESLVQSVREKEIKAMEDQYAGVHESERRKQMIKCLPKLFDVIYLTFQSMQRSIMTKQELMYKIILGHGNIVDKEETEEQLKLMQELAPDWISEKMSSSGDLLFRVNKTVSPESIHARLAEAE